MSPDNLLLRAFADPGLVAGLGAERLELVLSQARLAGLSARLSYRMEDAGAIAALPDRVNTQFAAARGIPPPGPGRHGPAVAGADRGVRAARPDRGADAGCHGQRRRHTWPPAG